MKNKSFVKRIAAVALSLFLIIGLLPMGTNAATTSVPGAEGHVLTNMVTATFTEGYDSTIFVYVTPNASDSIQYRMDSGGDYGVFAVPTYDSETWYFDGWRTWYKGSFSGLGVTTSDKANPKYNDTYNYFEESAVGFRSDGVWYPPRSIRVRKEMYWKGTYYLSAIFKPIVTVNSGDGIAFNFISAGSNTIAATKYGVKYQNTATVSYEVEDAYVVTSVGVNGTGYTASNGTVSLESIVRPVTVSISTRLKQQTVNFDANGGNGTMSAQTFEHSVAQALTANSFTRSGYTFDGWNTQADGSGTAYGDKASATFAPANDGDSITLYAQWTACTNHSWVNGICEFCGASCSAHSYVYSSDGNTITEACANGCTHNETATITKPDTLVYDGAAKEATVTYSDNWKGGELTITYSANGNIKAGDVTASIEKGGTKATVDFTIEKIVITVTVNDVSAKQYDALPVFTYTVSGMLPTDEWITKPVVSTQADMQSAGTFEITASGGDAGTNYTITYVPGTLTVSAHTEHIGGTATCTEQAICTLCNQPYGKLAEHSYGTEWKTDANKHWHECSCGAKADEAAHSGGTATCTEKAVCTDCSAAYGDLAKHNYGTEWKKDASGHWHECSCGEKADVSVHIPGDAATEYAPQTCTECGYEIAPALGHNHTWGNWISNGDGTHTRTCSRDSSHTESENCTGGTATCAEKAICTDCATAYGDLAKHNYVTEWKTDADKHWHECSCGAKADEAAHSGGTATCTEKAICSACNAAYGNLANHTYKDGKCTVCQAAGPNYVPETESPQTGDSSHLALWIALLFISGGAVIALTVFDRKKREEK